MPVEYIYKQDNCHLICCKQLIAIEVVCIFIHIRVFFQILYKYNLKGGGLRSRVSV